MDQRIKELIHFTKEKYGLHEYNLHTFDIYRNTTIFKDTVYTLSTEWFPNDIKDWDDETYNPEGTATIEIDIHSRKTKRIILSRDKSSVDCLTFNINNKDEIIKWIEKETGLKYRSQFEFWKEEEGAIHFKECIDGVAVSPSGYIELKLDKDGKLTLFSVYGHFPSKKLIKQETYSLSLEQVETIAREQLKLLELPVSEQKELIPVFALEEIYIKNNGDATLPFQFFVDHNFSVQLEKVMEWNPQLSQNHNTFQRKFVSLNETVTADQAFQCEGHPDLLPITESEVETCIRHMQDFLSKEYPNDSGKWVLKALYRELGYIHATLKAKDQNERVFIRKMKVIIHAETYEVLNYVDNQPFLAVMYKDLKEPENIIVTKEEALEKLKAHLELTPYYVYDFEQGCYILCGKLDCQFAVKADNGEVVELNAL